MSVGFDSPDQLVKKSEPKSGKAPRLIVPIEFSLLSNKTKQKSIIELIYNYFKN
jgi:hypothetical protein